MFVRVLTNHGEFVMMMMMLMLLMLLLLLLLVVVVVVVMVVGLLMDSGTNNFCRKTKDFKG